MVAVVKKKEEAPHENSCGTGNENGSVRYDSQVWEAVQCPTGVHCTPLVSDCGYLRRKWNTSFLSVFEYCILRQLLSCYGSSVKLFRPNYSIKKAVRCFSWARDTMEKFLRC